MPIARRKLTKREEILLLRASKLNGLVFPPWDGTPDAAEFVLAPDGNKFRQASINQFR